MENKQAIEARMADYLQYEETIKMLMNRLKEECGRQLSANPIFNRLVDDCDRLINLGSNTDIYRKGDRCYFKWLALYGVDIAALTSPLGPRGGTCISVAGLRGTEKSRFMKHLWLGDIFTTIGDGFIVESVSNRLHGNLMFHAFDVSGGVMHLPPFLETCGGLIFVVDSHNPETINQAREALDALLATEEMRDAVLLVCLDKHDASGMSTEMVYRELALDHVRQTRIFEVSTLTGVGIAPGLEWLIRTISHNI